MKSQTRVFTEDGIQYNFNSIAFRSRIDSVAKEKGVLKGQLADDLATGLCVTTDAINNWKYGKNGPADLDTLKKAADILYCDWRLLARRIDGGIEMKQLTDRQKDAVKRIYDVLVWFLEEFESTDGFCSWLSEFSEQGSKHAKEDTYERITQMEHQIRLVMNQEYFDLHDHEIYGALCAFASEDLDRVYDRKVDYGYRIDPDYGRTVWDDYTMAKNKLNEIIEKYL